MARHGTRTSYNEGCRCDKCKTAEAEYQKRRRHGVGTVTPINPTVTETGGGEPQGGITVPPVGPVETGVIEECKDAPVAKSRPGLYQMALALARVLDNPVTVAQHPSAAHRLSEILSELRKGADRKGKLASVRQMTQPKVVAG